MNQLKVGALPADKKWLHESLGQTGTIPILDGKSDIHDNDYRVFMASHNLTNANTILSATQDPSLCWP